MTPKEKAIWIVNKLMQFAESEYADSTSLITGAHMRNTKQCALIMVNEIIEEDDYNNAGNFLPSKRGKYWEEVKREIEQL